MYALRDAEELCSVDKTVHAPHTHFTQAWFHHAHDLGLAFEYAVPADRNTLVMPYLGEQVTAHMSANGIRVPETDAVVRLPVPTNGLPKALFKIYWAKARGKNNNRATLHHWSVDNVTYAQLEDSSKRFADPDGSIYVIIGQIFRCDG